MKHFALHPEHRSILTDIRKEIEDGGDGARRTSTGPGAERCSREGLETDRILSVSGSGRGTLLWNFILSGQRWVAFVHAAFV